jgi:Zn-dependent M16 (insulinase) family peptidase
MTVRHFTSTLLLASAAALLPLSAPAAEPAGFAEVTPQTTSHGFRAAALYLNDAGQPFGARFIHQKTGFTLDLIQVQSVPQSFIWVNSFPISDRGEPHTQEHLLLGKGNRGRAWSASLNMTLTEMTAFTMQWRTCYSFNTKAGLPVFYDEFHLQMYALLHPDYTDEEIRREVRNFGISLNPATRQLRLEEKGSVYNEMISSMNNPGRALFRQVGIDEFGPAHPLARNSGGEPSGIREMKPEDIRNFHREHYFLANMGAISSLPKGETLAVELSHFDQILNQLEPAPSTRKPYSEADLPAPSPAAPGSIQVVDFPFQNDKQPSFMALAWPANRRLGNQDRLLLDLFANSFAGDAGTNLYKLFVNSKTRTVDLGATSVFANLSDDVGSPLLFGFTGIPATNLTEAKTKEARTAVLHELNRIAALPDGSAELADLNARISSRLTGVRRQLSKLINTPPGFGARGTAPTWMEHLYALNKEGGFRKSVTMQEDLAAVEKLLSGAVNPWRDRLRSWHLTDTEPFGVVTHPSPALLKQLQQEQTERANVETARLEAKYGVTDPQEAIKRYQAEYDGETAKLDALAQKAGDRKFLDHPPLTLDGSIEFQTTKLAGGVPLVSSYFDNMTSATTALDLRLDIVPEADLPLLSLLPALLTQTGVIDNGTPIPYERVTELLRREVLSLNAAFRTNLRTDRVELAVSGSGNNLAESKRALGWMRLVLEHPDWRADNLPRLRDLVTQSLSGLRTTMQGSEESWVMNPVQGYWKQTNPLYLTTQSFLTRAWNADRLRWMLEDLPDRAGVADSLAKLADSVLADSKGDRAQLKKLAEATQPKLLGDDLAQLLADLPDAGLAADWRYLCNQLRADILTGPDKTLARLNALRVSLLNTGNARLWTVGSRANLAELKAPLQALTGILKDAHPAPVKYAALRRIDVRLKDHQGDTATPRFVGLYNPNLTGGVIATKAPSATYDDIGRDAQLDYLASRLFAGAGAHGLFTKTIGSGLAYSNGIRSSLKDGYSGYYAERMPEIPQTLHFAIDVVKQGSREPQLSEYAVSLAFNDSYSSNSYEDRAESVAADLADGLTADKVRRFRTAILALRRDPNLPAELFRRVDSAYGKLLPGYGPKAKDMPGVVNYIIGNDKQFSALDADVQTREDEHVYKLYPRDYWLVQ